LLLAAAQAAPPSSAPSSSPPTSSPAASPAAPAAAIAPQPPITTPSGLRFQTLSAGTGPRPALEDAVLVMYQGRLADGTVFDASQKPVGFGVQDLIPGFTEALLLMNKGGTYRFRIPSHLAYGEKGGGPIPPNAELEFTVLLLDIGKAAPAPAAPPAN
jgi:FKBP-type peptidyl-prolyl cis-trans isomerase